MSEQRIVGKLPYNLLYLKYQASNTQSGLEYFKSSGISTWSILETNNEYVIPVLNSTTIGIVILSWRLSKRMALLIYVLFNVVIFWINICVTVTHQLVANCMTNIWKVICFRAFHDVVGCWFLHSFDRSRIIWIRCYRQIVS